MLAVVFVHPLLLFIFFRSSRRPVGLFLFSPLCTYSGSTGATVHEATFGAIG